MTSALDTLPPLKEVIARHGLMAKKSLGQNFLLDLNLTAKIARAAGRLDGINVIEVGPGPGGLTRALLGTTAAQVVAIERDDRCVAALQDLVTASGGRLTVIPDDATKIDYAALCPAPRALVANLPYNVATPLLIGWLKQAHLFESLTLMFQREVAERLTARTRTKDYGRLSVVAQWICEVDQAFDIPPSAFTPPPQVTSTVVRLAPRRNRTDGIPFEAVEKVTAAAFGQRRKMLRQSLKSLTPEPETLLARAGIPGTARAEEIDVAGFLRLTEAFLTV